MDNKEKNKNRSFFLYAALGLLIFLGVQQYNENINAPEPVSFSEFKSLINEKKVEEAIIKEQSNTVHFEVIGKSEVFKTEYPEGFEGEAFQLLVDEEIALSTDTEPAGFQDYFIAFLPWLFLAGFMFYMFSQVRTNGNQIMQFGNLKLKRWTKKLLRSLLMMLQELRKQKKNLKK